MPLEHATARITPFMEARTAHPPGVSALAPDEWLLVDETYADQIALRERLLKERREIVLQGDSGAAAEECLHAALDVLLAQHDFTREGNSIRRPDGGLVWLDSSAPLATLGQLAQEDFLVLEKADGEAEHVLTGGILCFPSRWSLTEKMNRALIGIHARVPGYEGDLAPRVQRFFDALRPGRPLWRANWLVHATPALFQPVDEADKIGVERETSAAFWLRVERQCLVKLPETGAVVFTVKTLVTPLSNLTAPQLAGLGGAMDEQSDDIVRYHGGASYHQTARAEVARMLSVAQTAT
ncbi:MAG: heme-dependent oxidative N-demethylase family protein [Pikeienuella sp.]